MTALELHRGWGERGLLDAVRGCFAYVPGEDRVAGCLYAPADGIAWPGPLAADGPALLGALKELTGIRFAICAFQAYRNGSGCGWHADTPFGAQAILSLGIARLFGWRRADGSDEHQTLVNHGDLVVMPDGFQQEWEHCVPAEDVPGERVALVFRTPGG